MSQSQRFAVVMLALVAVTVTAACTTADEIADPPATSAYGAGQHRVGRLADLRRRADVGADP